MMDGHLTGLQRDVDGIRLVHLHGELLRPGQHVAAARGAAMGQLLVVM